MSNPIADNLDYFTQQQETSTSSNKPFNQHEYHLSLRHHHHTRLQQGDPISSPSSPNEAMQDYSPFALRRPDPSLWHSFVRRMSGVVPFPSTMPEHDDDDDNIAPAPYSEYTSPFGTAAQYRPPPMLGEDDNLPSMEEVVKEGIRAATSAELKENYFEHPFESDTSAPGSAELPPTAPWDTRPINDAVVDAFEKYDEELLTHWRHNPSSEDLAQHLKLSLKEPDLDPKKEADKESDKDRRSMHRIDLQYGEIKWTVVRSNVDFYYLDMRIGMSNKFRGGSFGNSQDVRPAFPAGVRVVANRTLASMMLKENDKEEELLKRRSELEQYLRELVRRSKAGFHHELCEFLEISDISIVRDMGWKGKEGFFEYREVPTSALVHKIRRTNWTKQWIIIRDSYIAFCKDVHSTVPTDVLFFDTELKVNQDFGFARIHNYHVSLSNATRRLEFKGKAAEGLYESLKKVRSESPWVSGHRYKSFAPMRLNVKAKWFVDGHEYFDAVADAILSAKSEIYIEDWWLTPQLYLRRPPKGNEEYRIDRILKRKAELDGVKIYIVIYRSMAVALPLDSQHTKNWMQNVHPNIIVLRHSNIATSPFWAHHEKILVIDNRLAFIGGLDLCFGRYDTHSHDLTDYLAGDERNPEIFPGQDYSNPRVKDFTKVSRYDMETIDKRLTPRMPWHDIHVGMVGQPARDIARHFIQRWNFIKSTTRARDRGEVPYLMPKGEYVSSRDEKKFRGTCRVQIVRSSAEWSLGIPREHSIYTAYMECISKAKHFIYIENQFFITATDSDDKQIKNMIGEALVNRIERAYREKEKFRVIVVIPSAPGFEGDFASPDRRSMALRSVAHYQYMSISRGSRSVLGRLHQKNIPAEEYIGFYSLRNWGRIKQPEQSPPGSNIKDDSPLDSIATVVGGEGSNTNNNNIGGGGGFLGRSNSGKQNRKRSRQKNGINGGSEEQVRRSRQDSLKNRSQYPDDRMDYVTEQVYIHSKLMIVDDKTVICGSANINDRSQLGNRDSEIATVIEDTDLVPSRMNGVPYNASRFALTLRMNLFKEHLGIDNNSASVQLSKGEQWKSNKLQSNLVMDPLDDTFFHEVWNRTAKENTDIYHQIFRCVPDDTVPTFEVHRRFVPDPNRIPAGHIADPANWPEKRILDELNKIRGHLVTFPTEYLCRDNMLASIVQEAVPPAVFT